MLHADLFEPRTTGPPVLEPWRPRSVPHEQWPPPYARVYAWRMRQLSILRSDKALLEDAHVYYSTRPAAFIMDWMDTFNPRKKGNKWMPFILFKRQMEFIDYLEQLRHDGENGLVEKCRDIGATWLSCAYSVWTLCYIPDDSTGWGSRKENLVDKLGDADSIFEKIRQLIDRLPKEFRPQVARAHMKVVNKVNGATVTGEAGDNIGRGGRKSRFFKDEAQPLDAGILTPFGWKRMGDTGVGDIIAHPDGSWQQITHINDCGTHTAYRITLVDGTTTTCSENHLWTVRDIRPNRSVTLRTVEMYENYKNARGTYKYATLPTEPIEFIPQINHPLHPYIVGVLLGDGSIKSVPKYRPTFTSVDQFIVDEVRALLPETCHVVSDKDGKTHRLGDIEGRRGRFKVSRASQAIMLAGIAGHGAETKFIPHRYKFASVDDRIALLQGLMDTDGSASGGTLTYHTCSKQLADDVRFIVQSLGGRASLNVKPNKHGYRDIYVLHVVFANNSVIPFRLPRKIAQMKPRCKLWGHTIAKIEPIGTMPVRCITVDNEDGLYLTDNCIVTHNSAHYERPELVEAALGDNTDVQIDISSVNGLGNVFHRRREAGQLWTPGAQIEPGITRVFIFDWRDHPEKTQEWYNQRKAKAEREGMQHVFAQEVDRNYSAAVDNTVIMYEWLEACVDAHLKLPVLFPEATSGNWMAGVDVADEGTDRNALALRQSVILRAATEWGERDPGVSTRRMLGVLRELQMRGIDIQYDCIGIGAALRSEYNRLCDIGAVTAGEFNMVPWHAGASVVEPFARVIPDDEQSARNRDFFENMKAQAWWAFRTRCYKTWRAVTHGDVYRADELVSIDGSIPLLHQVLKELAQPTRGQSARTLKLVINKTPQGTKSPNCADSIIMAYFPAPESGSTPETGSYGG